MKNWKLLLGFGITAILLGVAIIIGFTILNVLSAAEADAAYQACITRGGIYETNDTGEMVGIAEACSKYLR